MNKKVRYCSIFLVFTALLLLSTSMVSASDIDDNVNAEISDNTITNTVSDDTNVITQTVDNNKESQTIEKEVEKTRDTNTTTTSKELNNNGKNIKQAVSEGELKVTPDTAKVGDTVTLELSASGSPFFLAGTYPCNITLDGNDFLTGNATRKSSTAATMTIVIPEYEPGTYTMYAIATKSNRGASGSTTFTITADNTETAMSPISSINTGIGNVTIPVIVTDIEGNSITGTSTITVKNGDEILVENYAIEDGIAEVIVPMNTPGNYTLTVEFAQTSKYGACSANVEVSVSKLATTLIVDQAEDDLIYEIINVLNNQVITGTLVQTSSNNPIGNTELTLNVNGETITITTDSEGKFEYSYDVTQIDENIPISIIFSENDLYYSSNEVSGSFDIESLDVNIVLDEVSLSEVGENTTISGSVIDNYNHIIPNVEVNLDFSCFTGIETVVTDNEGRFSYITVFNQTEEDVMVVASIDNEIYSAEDEMISFNVIKGIKSTILNIEVGDGADTTINIVDITPYFNEVITNGTLIDNNNQPVSNVPIKILINGEDYSQTTDSEGTFSVVYNATEGLTSYNISVQFEGNDDYKAANEIYNGTFTTEAFDVTVYLDDNLPDEILIGDSITLTGSITLQNQTLTNYPLILSIDGTTYTTTTDDEGKYSHEYTVGRNGSIPVIVNTTFENADIKAVQTNIFVDKPAVTVELDDISNVFILRDVTLNGRIYFDSDDTGLYTNVTLKINDITLNLESDEEGYFTYTFTPETVGEYTVSAGYDDVRYDIKNTSTTINVTKIQTQLVSDKLPIAVKVGDIFSISGQLIDYANEGIANKEIIFIINDETYTNTTDEEGYYNYNYVTTVVGDNNLYEVRYDGDNQYERSENYIGSFFDVEKLDTIVTINYSKESNVFTITGKLSYEDMKPVSNSDVKLIIDDDIEEIVTTDDNGNFTYTYKPEPATTHTIFAEYEDSISNILTIVQDKSDTKVEIANFTAIVGKNITLNALITDNDNNPVTGGKVAFKVNGKTLKDENNKVIYCQVVNGEASINDYTVPESWKDSVNITAIYSGTTSYTSSKANTTIQVHVENVTITLTQTNITVKSNSTITITANIKNNQDENIYDGKVIFKLNGKTIKDENGKVVYINVTDGQISYDYNVPGTLKEKTYTLEAVYTSKLYNRCEDTMNLTINNSINSNIIPLSSKKLLRDTPTTHIITNDNIDDYITQDGLSELVNPGDTLDIQGLIDREHSLVINKPVNVISSTKDAFINLHTVAGSLSGEDPGNSFVVNNAGSGSNISSVYLNNTECWIYNTYDVTLYNMTMHVQDARVGSGVGQTAIRYSERITIDSCYIYTENNGGSTSMALTDSSDVVIKNTTIHGVQGAGQVGNILYLANPYNQADKPEGFVERNTNITLVNSTVLGECVYAITVAVKNFASNCTFINNTFNTSGSYGNLELGHGGKAIGNTFYNESSLYVNYPGDVINNTFYEDARMKVQTKANYVNNTASYVEYRTNADLTKNNTIYNIIMCENTELSNTTIEGNVLINAKLTMTELPNINITNNTIKGNVEILGRSRNSRCDGTLIENNNIGGNITISYARNNIINNNTINGTVTITNQSLNAKISNNTIVTDNEYAIINSISSTNINNNYLMANGKIGNDALNSSSGIIEDNGPETLEYLINIEDVNAIVGDVTTITVTVKDPTGKLIQEGQVYLMINNEILVDENANPIVIDVTEGQAVFENIEVQENWLKSDTTLSAYYIGSSLNSSNNTTPNINKREALVEITTENITLTHGQTITLQARVTDNERLINGQLAFKLNGKSLKDDDNQLIYVDVVDGIATLEYTLPEYMAPGTYTLTAVFKNQTYVRLYTTEEMIID